VVTSPVPGLGPGVVPPLPVPNLARGGLNPTQGRTSGLSLGVRIGWFSCAGFRELPPLSEVKLKAFSREASKHPKTLQGNCGRSFLDELGGSEEVSGAVFDNYL